MGDEKDIETCSICGARTSDFVSENSGAWGVTYFCKKCYEEKHKKK